MPPPNPYIVYGTVKKDDVPVPYTTVTITNMTAGGSDTQTTDISGNYIYDDLSQLPNGYTSGDTIKVSTTDFILTFTALSSPEEKQMDLFYYGRKNMIYIQGIKQEIEEVLSFGTGADGEVTISTNTTLAADKNYTNLTVNNGVTLTPDGYKILCTGTLTNNGTISALGNDSSGYTGGAGLTSHTFGGSGSGGSGNGSGGGSGGGVIYIAAKTIVNNGTVTTKGGDCTGTLWSGAEGGGSGGAGIANSLGGNGGSGGGVGGTNSKNSACTGAVTRSTTDIKSIIKNPAGINGGGGGAGGAAYASGAYLGNGGGGGGGAVILVYLNLTTEGTINISGGNGIAGNNTSHSGCDGSPGTYIKYNINLMQYI